MYDDGKAVAVSCDGAMPEITAPPPQMVVSEGEAWGLLSMAGGFLEGNGPVVDAEPPIEGNSP